MMKLVFEKPIPFEDAYRHTFREVIEPLLEQSSIEISVGFDKGSDLIISKEFIDRLVEGKWAHKHHFHSEPLINHSDGSADYFSTILYMLNSLQEYNKSDQDALGRFKYDNSYQKKYDCAELDLVSRYASQLIKSTSKLNSLPVKTSSPSRIFLSHDNDVFYGSLRYDGFAAIKQGRIDWLLPIIFNELFRQPHWLNMDYIMDLEDEYDVKSTFFWLVNKGPVHIPGLSKPLRNADYDFKSTQVQSVYKNIEKAGWENGLHKSISNQSFDEESALLNHPPIANRNHYLKLEIPNHFQSLDASSIKMDSSVGFAEHTGWRNSYSKTYKPYDFENNKACNFVEVPLGIMDTTFWTYLKWKPQKIQSHVLDFLDKHKHDALFGILWHNKYFTKYKFRGYLEIYKVILQWMKENEVRSIQPDEILDKHA